MFDQFYAGRYTNKQQNGPRYTGHIANNCFAAELKCLKVDFFFYVLLSRWTDQASPQDVEKNKGVTTYWLCRQRRLKKHNTDVVGETSFCF